MASINEDKVMDVSKPGKGKVVSTSRPVVVKTDSDKTPDKAETRPKDEEAEKAVAPSVSHKVIQPLNQVDNEKPEEVAEAKAKDVPAQQQAKEKEPEDTKEEATTDGSAEAAGVDELAKTAETKKMAAKQAEEDAKKDAELRKLAESKKYFVPINGAKTDKTSNKSIIVVLIIVVLSVVGYLLIDLGLFGSNIKLPFEFFKSDDTAPMVQESTQTTKSEEASTATPIDKAHDAEIRSELRILQNDIEEHFTEMGAYPGSLSDITPALKSELTIDSKGNNYVYTTDGTTYELTAELSDGSKYILVAVTE